MSEGIEFNEIGSVDVTFDDKTYHLGRPKFRQYKYFSEKLEQAHDEVRDELDRLRRLADAAEEAFTADQNPETTAALDDATRQMREFSRAPFYTRTTVILAEMFDQVGDPLPEDPDDWPAWLAADSSIPGDIVKHWRTHPKASSRQEAKS